MAWFGLKQRIVNTFNVRSTSKVDSKQLSGRRRQNARRRRQLKTETLEPKMLLAADLIISEFLAVNDNDILDEDGDGSDWIEILNAGNTVESLKGWHLTDDADELDKWTFPDVNLSPGETMIVFASNKNERDADRPLHTNFRLTSNGEYLALVDNDEIVAFEYAPTYAPQVPDVSYGVPAESISETLLSSGADAKILIPLNGDLDSDPLLADATPAWVEGGFDDAAWTSATTGIGYEVEPSPPLPGLLIADSVSEFGDQQGLDSWSYGYWDQGEDANGLYAHEDMIEFPRGTSTRLGAFNRWDGTKWDLAKSDRSPLTEVTETGGHPAAGAEDEPGQVHLPVRRYTAEFDGPIRISGTLANADAAGDGVIGRIFVDGTEVFNRLVNGESAEYSVAVSVSIGSRVDFLIDAGSAENQTGDQTDFTASIESLPSLPAVDLAGTFSSDVQGQMLNVGSSAYIRIPFDVADPSDFQSLVLRIKYDAGFTAYLNGVVVASDNTPERVAFDSIATAERDDRDAIKFVDVDLSGKLDILSSGQNILAIHGINVDASDPDFLIDVEIVAGSQTVDTSVTRYFVSPTPGGPNGFGSEDIGPIVAGLTHSPEVLDDDSEITITATVTPSLDPIDTVTVHYRWMFEAEQSLEMFDDGAHGDGAAGDNVYGAILPSERASRAGHMFRYFVTATDVDADETRVPTFEDPLNSEEYFGTVIVDPTIESNLPVFHRFLQNPGAAGNDAGTRGALFYDGEFYDNIHFSLHGQSSRGFPKKSQNVDFNRGRGFRLEDDMPRMKDINLLGTWADYTKLHNTLAYDVFTKAGHLSLLAFPVRVQENGVFHSVTDFVEDAKSESLERQGANPNNALYKMYNTFSSAGNALSGAEKKSRRWEFDGVDDPSEKNLDLQQLQAGVSLSGTARTNFIFDNVSLAGMANYMAAYTITSSTDCCHKNYYLYRDSEGTGEWEFLPWDLDLSFGRAWGGFGLSYFDDTTYADKPLWIGSNNGMIQALRNTPGFEEMYMRRLRTLMDEQMQAPGTPEEEKLWEQRIHELHELIGADGDRDAEKWNPDWGQRGHQTFDEGVQRLLDEYTNQRREYLYGLAAIPGGQDPNAMLEFGAIEFAPESGNQDEEFIEIHNPTTDALDISFWTVEGQVSHTFKPGTVIPAGWTLYLSPDVNAFRLRSSRGPSSGQGLFIQGDYQGQLSRRGGTLEIHDTTGRLAGSIDYVGDPLPAQDSLRITELMYNPIAPDGADPFEASGFEFIELQNIGGETIDLSNLRFSEGIEFAFAGSDVTSLAAGEYVLIVKNSTVFESRYDTAGLNIAGEFQGSLDNGGEDIRLEDISSEKILDFDYKDSWHVATDGAGFSLHIVDAAATAFSDWDEAESWQPSREFGGSPGSGDAFGMPEKDSIIISEVVANTGNDAADWIELHNTTDAAIDISHWFLSDNPTKASKYQIPADTVIEAGGYVAFHQGDNFDFGLSSFGEWAVITGGDSDGNLLGYQARQQFDASEPGVALGLHTNSTNKTQFVALSEGTPGAANALPKVGPVVISEIMYHPLSGGSEFIEIENTSGDTVALGSADSAWSLTNGVEFSFSAGDELVAGGRGLIVPIAPADFRATYGIAGNVPIFGPYDGGLSNNGERLELSRPSVADGDGEYHPILVDHVRYNDTEPWPFQADGLGTSLERVALDGFGDDVASWRRSAAGGTPGGFNVGPDTTPPSVPSGVDADLIAGGNVRVSWQASADAESGIAVYLVYRDGEQIATTAETEFTEEFVFGSSDYLYQIAAVNGDEFESPLSSVATVPTVESAAFQRGVSPDGYNGAEDTYISETNPDRSYGSAGVIFADGDAGGDMDQVALLRWDISDIPQGARVISATLQLTLDDGSSGRFEVYEVKQDWKKSDANWLEFADGQSWQQAGGTGDADMGVRILASIGFSKPETTAVPLNLEGIDAVQRWIDGDTTNNGFAIRNPDTADEIGIKSNDWRAGATNRPALVIEYVTEDTTPSVSEVLVGGSGWSSQFTDHLAATGQGGAAGIAVTSTDPLPWSGADQITVVFDGDSNVSEGDITLVGLSSGDVSIEAGSFTYDAATNTAVWTLTEPLTNDRYQLSMGAAVPDFELEINVLPADGDLSGDVSIRDLQDLRNALLSTVGDAVYEAKLDFNASGTIDIRDVQVLRDNMLDELPVAATEAPAEQVFALLAETTVDDMNDDSQWADSVDRAIDEIAVWLD